VPGEITAVLAALCYSLSYVLLRKGQVTSAPKDNGLLPILTISFVTLSGSVAAQWLADPEDLDHVALAAIYFCMASGLVGTLMGRLALYTAISRVGATRGIVVKTLSPAITTILAMLLLDEDIHAVDGIGMVIIIIGILVLFPEQHRTMFRGRAFMFFQQGIVVAVAAAIFQSIGHIFRKLGMGFDMDPVLAAAIDITTAFVAYTAYLMGRRQLTSLVTDYVRNRNLYIVAAGFTSAAGVLLFFNAVAEVPVSHVSVILATEPLFVALFSTLLLHNVERLSLWTLCSAVLVVTGVVVMSL